MIQFYSLLENAFPQDSVVVQPKESSESYVNEIRGLYFNGQNWRSIDLPEDENDAIEPAFDLLDDYSKMYYIAAYMRESIVDPYYIAGCLTQLRHFSGPDNLILGRMTPYQRESIVWYCDLVEQHFASLPMMERIAHGMDIITTKSLRSQIRNTLW